LGQDLLRATAGESFNPAAREVDLDGAEEAYRAAVELARAAGDDATLASALREIAVVQIGRLRAWFVDQVAVGAHLPIMQRVAAGESLDEILPELPIAPLVYEAHGLLQQALELFERLGDRRGAMASIIALGYLSWAADIHLGSGSARHIEEIRRLTSTAKAFTNESERAAFEAQMLFGVHVFARAKLIPDLALSRGEQAAEHARQMGDRSLEFAAAGGTAMSYLDLGEVTEAAPWIERAAAIASEHPTPLRARRLETWRGMAAAAAGDAAGMRTHLERAVQLAGESGLPAARCEALARLALEASRLGADAGDAELLDTAEQAATEAAELAATMPGHPPWGAEASASLSRIALARGRPDEAADHARSALGALQSAQHEDVQLDVAVSVANALVALPEWEQLRPYLQQTLAMIAQRTVDEDVRVRWFRSPIGRELTRLVGPVDQLPAADGFEQAGVDPALLKSLMHGKTNGEIADELGIDESAVVRQLAELYAQIGATSRAEATAFAFRERVL
jgi:tetratricopeptide (TPR) repeat protein